MADRVWKILQEHADAAHAVLLRLTLRRDVAEELLQELLVKLAESDTVLRAEKPAAYIRRAAINLGIDWRRKRPRETEINVELSGREVGPVERSEAAEEVERILDAVKDLSDLEREAFVLRLVEGEPYDRVGEMMGKTAHQARGLCHAAVRRVREMLTERRVNT